MLRKRLRSMRQVIYADIEPGIINNKMIVLAYRCGDFEEGSEEWRLHQMEKIDLKKMLNLRLEFKNILRIDHLWVVPNLTHLSLAHNNIEKIQGLEILTGLKVLNLSFNHIEKMAGLELLVNLEELSLFNNEIEKVENLDSLEKLEILSIGNNHIVTLDGLERLRFLKTLRALNLEGNPISENEQFSFSQYIKALLPQLEYYCYEKIMEDDRAEAVEKFSRELRQVKENEDEEVNRRAHLEKERIDAERLSSSFVEQLNGHQLYLSMWENDEDGKLLLRTGLTAVDLNEEYKNDMFEITQQIYLFGLERSVDREAEVKDFEKCRDEGLKEIQLLGQKAIDKFLVQKEKIFEEAWSVARTLEVQIASGEDEESTKCAENLEKFEDLREQFDEVVSEYWDILMGQELHLHEVLEEQTVSLQRKLEEMMSKFIEYEQAFFLQLREIAVHFSEHILEITTRYVTEHLALQEFDDVPEELMYLMEDREAVTNLVAGMKDAHVQKIDEREDRMITRCKKYIENYVDNLTKEEHERNRAKVMEINFFFDNLTDIMSHMREDMREEILQDDGD